jgi:hypothetical protein
MDGSRVSFAKNGLASRIGSRRPPQERRVVDVTTSAHGRAEFRRTGIGKTRVLMTGHMSPSAFDLCNIVNEADMRGALPSSLRSGGDNSTHQARPESEIATCAPEITKIKVVEMVVVPMQNGRKPCTAIT